jgi:hypothetical protein
MYHGVSNSSSTGKGEEKQDRQEKPERQDQFGSFAQLAIKAKDVNC